MNDQATSTDGPHTAVPQPRAPGDELADAPRARERRLELAAEVAELGVFTWDAQSDRFRSETLRNYTIFGRTPEDPPLSRQEFFERFVHPEDREPLERQWLECLRSGRTLRAVCRIRRQNDRAWRWLEVAASFELHADGSPRCLTGVIRDITERRRSEDEIRRLAAIIEATSDFVGIAEPGGRLLFVNAAGRRMVGIAQEADLAQYSHADLCPRWVFERTQSEWLPAALREGAVSGEGALLTRDGREIPVSFVLLVHRDSSGEMQALATVARDITERKRAEQALLEADRKKDEFLAVLAHELRNPLAPIHSAVQYLKLRVPADADLQSARAILERQTRHIARLVDDLLDLSRITRGRILLRKEPMSLGMAIAAAIEACRPQLEAARHELTVQLAEEPLHVDGDLARLSQVFANLLSNAVKYTAPGGRITLCTRREGREALVGIRDSGIGIPAEMLERIFEMFTQVDPSLERSHGGLGIGLTLARQLVQLHGGRIEARSEGPGRGSEFTVRLPLSTSAALSGSAPEKQAGACGARRRVLIADDNVDAAESLSMVLQLAGHEVHTARDGAEAVAAVQASRPDVVVLDIGMPGLNGYEAARRIRALPGGAALLLIALTGWGQPEHRKRAREAGFDHHLVKPVDPQALQELLAAAG